MKSSPVIHLMITVATIGVIMTAIKATNDSDTSSTETEAVPSFSNLDDCTGAGNTADQCKTAYDAAFENHTKSAPHFSDKELCEKNVDVDQCVATRIKRDDGTFEDVFVPAMAGFLLGNLLADKDRDSRSSYGSSYYYGGRYYTGGPIYRSRAYEGSYRSSGELAGSGYTKTVPQIGSRSTSVGKSSGLATYSQRPANVKTTTISRSGFGSTSFSVGGGGS